MKILVMGTGGFIIPSLELLSHSMNEIVAVCTMPLKKSPKGEKMMIAPVRQMAISRGIPLLEPENINDTASIELLRQFDFDIIFICDYGKILSPDVISLAPYGGINLHGSLLPKYRGAAPINRAILAGEEEIGVSVIRIIPQVDAGPVIAMASYYPHEYETAIEIEEQLALLGASLVLDAINSIEIGRDRPIEQDRRLVSQAPKLSKEEGRIPWNCSNIEIINRYRGLQPWPKTFSDWYRTEPKIDSPPTRLILGPFERVLSSPSSNQSIDHPPGTVLVAEKENLIVQTGTGELRIKEVQPSGKKKMSAESFLCGYRIKPGDLLR